MSAPLAWHDSFGVDAHHAYFVVGGNPDKSGGGVIRSSNDWRTAWDTLREAERRGYLEVEVLRAEEFWRVKGSAR